MQLLLSQKKKLIFSLKKRSWEQVLHNRYWTLCGWIIFYTSVSEVAQNNKMYVVVMLFWRLTVKAENILFIQRDKLRADRATTHRTLGLWNQECTKTKKFKRSAIQWMCINYTEVNALGPWWNQTLHFIWQSTTSNLPFRGSRTTVLGLKHKLWELNKLNSILKGLCDAGGIPPKTNHAGRKTLVRKLQDIDVLPNQIIQITGHKNLQSINNYSSLQERQIENISIHWWIMKFQRFRAVPFTFRLAHHLFNTISLQQAHRLRQCMKTSCKQCFMAMQLQEVFLTSIWPHHKVQWVALNLSLQRKSFTERCALSQKVEAAKKIDHDLVNREFSNKVVKKWLWETLRLTFVSNICHYILYSAL